MGVRAGWCVGRKLRNQRLTLKLRGGLGVCVAENERRGREAERDFLKKKLIYSVGRQYVVHRRLQRASQTAGQFPRAHHRGHKSTA